MNDPLHDVLPRDLDAEVDATYRRRRDADLARITLQARTAGRRRRVPGRPLLLTAIGAAGVAAAAIVVVPGTAGPDRPTPPGSAAPQATPGPQSVDARPFLLASARTAAAEPAKSGTYWYVRTRTVDLWGTENYDEPPVIDKRLLTSPFQNVWIAHSQDSWDGVNGRGRNVLYLDPKPTFADPAEEKRWRGMGSPSLLPEPTTTEYRDMAWNISLGGGTDIPWTKVSGLPGDPVELEKLLKKAAGGEDVRRSIFNVVQELLTEPIPPKTRAALFEVLARQPGIRATPGVKDLLGRPGTALSYNDDVRRQIVIDPATTRLLSTETMNAKAARGEEPRSGIAYEHMGWTDRMGPAVGRVTSG
ncbi:CU044_5270 family protein [Spirillospora sp. CA-253888]